MASAAFDMYIRNDTDRLATFGIRINNVNPGPVKTNIFVHGAQNETQEKVGLGVLECLERNAPFKVGLIYISYPLYPNDYRLF